MYVYIYVCICVYMDGFILSKICLFLEFYKLQFSTMYKDEAFKSAHFCFHIFSNKFVKLFTLLYLQCLFDLLVNVLHD